MSIIKTHFQRFEFKYLIKKSIADKILPIILDHMDWDDYIAGSKKDYYEVNSLYFDNKSLACFWEKESGVMLRKKLRFRYYNNFEDNKNIFLEIKRKFNALVIKDRMEFDQNNFTDSAYLDFLKEEARENVLAKELYTFKLKNSLNPILYVGYKRKAFYSPKNKKFRITLDYDIKTSLSVSLGERGLRTKDVYPEYTIIELKYNNSLPQWFHGIIQRFQLNRLAYSKYCNSLKSVNNNLDNNNSLI